MKISKKMLNEIDCLMYFLPDLKIWSKPTEQDIVKYFEWSTLGKHKKEKAEADQIKKKYNGFETLVWGNTWRNRHIYEMYEPAINDGTGYYSFIDETTPREVVDYLKKTMFRGEDAEIIEKVYKRERIVCA